MKVIRRGSKGEEVRILQAFLSLNIDGSFGPATERALKEYQKSKGLKVDGICGPATWASFQSPNLYIESKVDEVTYKKLKMIKVKPENIDTVLANKKFTQTTSKNLINGTFFWQGNPNGILVSKKKTLCGYSSHAYRGYPQSALYFDGKEVGVKRVTGAYELGNVEWAIGGLGMITPYGYSPTKEGFNGAYADVLRTTNKTVIAYKSGYIYLITAPSISHGNLLNLLKEYKLDYAVSLDGGGSTCQRINGKVILKSDGRTINNWVVVK